MANQIHNANMTIDEILAEPAPATVTPLRCGEPTPEEMEQAFDELFKEIWRKNR